MRTVEQQALLDILWEIKRNGPIFSNEGICGQLNDIPFTVWATFEDLRYLMFESWPEYSGRRAYPVPDPQHTKLTDPRHAHEYAYWVYHSMYDSDLSHNMWTGEYGSARIRLLNHCIRFLEAI